MSKVFTTEFVSMNSGPGIIDIAIRFNNNMGGNCGEFEFSLEENGIPVTVPAHILVGILVTMANHITQSSPFEERHDLP
ncbi:hypothetical protein D1872_81470 [compost metagenome]